MIPGNEDESTQPDATGDPSGAIGNGSFNAPEESAHDIPSLKLIQHEEAIAPESKE